MKDAKKELASLRRELAELEQEFGLRAKAIEGRVAHLENASLWTRSAQGEHASATRADVSEPVAEQEASAPANRVESIPPVSPLKPEAVPAEPQRAARTLAAHPAQATGGTVDESRREAVSIKQIALEGAEAAMASLFGPFAGLFEKLRAAYRHYKDQGKAPVLFMTVAGITALVLGFAFLLQYSFNDYLSETGKVIIAFMGAIAVTAGGVWFTVKKPDMADFGSSLIALGIILNYLCAYFAGPYFGLLSGTYGFLLLVSVTATAYLLARIFETRVVAVVSLIGGGLSPLMMEHVDQQPLVYLAYLLVLVVATLHLARHIRWQALAHTAMVVSAAMIQYTLLGQTGLDHSSATISHYLLVAVMHGFFYAFAFYAMSEALRAHTISRTTLMVISANILFFLAVLNQTVSNDQLLGYLYLGNALPWLLLFFYAGQTRATRVSDTAQQLHGSGSLHAFALIYAGLLIGVGILVLVDPALIGVVWGVEGLLLLYLGSRYQLNAVRVEAYAILLLSLFSATVQAFAWTADGFAPLPDLLLLNFDLLGWANLATACLLIVGAVWIIERYALPLRQREQGLLKLFNETVPFYLSALFLLSIATIWHDGFWLLSIVVALFLINHARRRQLVVGEWFGLAHYLLLFVPIAISADLVGGFRFSEQTLLAKVARVEAFLALWLIAEFYARYYPRSKLTPIVHGMRQLFYLIIPIFFLPSALRNVPELFPIILWLSATLALFLYSRVRYPVVRIEAFIAVFVASIGTIVACAIAEFIHWPGRAVEALGAGLVFYGALLWLGKGMQRHVEGSESFIAVRRAIRPLFAAAFYYFGFALMIVAYGASGSPLVAALTMLVYFTALLLQRSVLAPLRNNLMCWYRFAVVLLVFLIVLPFSGMVFQSVIQTVCGLVALICGGLMVYSRRPQIRLIQRRMGGALLHLGLFHLLVTMAYITFSAQWFGDSMGPAVSIMLVVHATLILFQTLNPRFQKLLWFAMGLFGAAAVKVLAWDMSDFSLIQKVIAFMVIGALLLGAAYQYQRMRKPGDVASISENTKNCG
ncbi:MAG: DUF2339 domain-containing protein [Gammaproteobacteria bacterium]|nr:DUF2339 domain-containing protein [Gammaproteobacteria bacterium]